MSHQKNKINPFTGSQFEEQEQWEETEHERRDDFHGDGDKRKSRTVSDNNLDMINQIQQRNKQIIDEKGIGHSKEPKKPSWEK